MTHGAVRPGYMAADDERYENKSWTAVKRRPSFHRRDDNDVIVCTRVRPGTGEMHSKSARRRVVRDGRAAGDQKFAKSTWPTWSSAAVAGARRDRSFFKHGTTRI